MRQNPVVFFKTPVQGPDFSLGTKSWHCFSPVTTTTTRTPHQNLSDWGVLEVRNLTHKLLRDLWLSLGGQASEGPMSQEKQEQNIICRIFYSDKGFTLTGVWHWRPSLVANFFPPRGKWPIDLSQSLDVGGGVDSIVLQSSRQTQSSWYCGTWVVFGVGF